MKQCCKLSMPREWQQGDLISSDSHAPSPQAAAESASAQATCCLTQRHAASLCLAARMLEGVGSSPASAEGAGGPSEARHLKQGAQHWCWNS